MKIGLFSEHKAAESPITVLAKYLHTQTDHEVTFEYALDQPTKNLNRFDLVVTWGLDKSGLHRQIQQSDIPHMVLENGWLGDRINKYRMVGFNNVYGHKGLNNRAWYPTEDELFLSTRWRYLRQEGVEFKPKRWKGKTILVVGQVHTDVAVQPYVDIWKWYRETVATIKRLSDKPVVFRYHPTEIRRMELMAAHKLMNTPPPGAILSPRHVSLQYELDNADVVVTFNSNTGVDAVLNGNKVIAVDKGAMMYDIVENDVTRINKVRHPKRNEVYERLYRMSHWQWSNEEIENGAMWNWYYPHTEKIVNESRNAN